MMKATSQEMTQEPSKGDVRHRCALCFGRGYRVRSEPAGRGTMRYTNRVSNCKRCGGTGEHGERRVKSRPLAATEMPT